MRKTIKILFYSVVAFTVYKARQEWIADTKREAGYEADMADMPDPRQMTIFSNN
jgi:hypothetical protein